MGKGKLALLIFVIVVVIGVLFFYMGKKNKQNKEFSANKNEPVVKVKGGGKIAKKKDSASTMNHEPIIGKKDRYSNSITERQAKEREYELNKEFEKEARDVLPLLSIQTNNPLDTKAFGPQRGEIWVRVKPDNARELKQIMKKLVDFYRSRTGYEETITIMHWVGGRPYLKMTFPANDENE